jgi:NAD(P)-dependent dehydrogenase (short-subunit alcohol dehydrogenase family)
MKKELLIFGSNGALGKGVAGILTAKDYDKVYLFDFHPNEKYSEQKTINIKIEDLSTEKNVNNAFTQIKPSKDTAFFLFSTVGGFAGGNKVWETDLSEWEQMMNMNLTTSYLIAKYFALLVKESHSGSLCFTSAYSGLIPESNKGAYGTSKSAMIHLVNTLASEGTEINLSVNAIAPYIIDTPANREWMKEADFEPWMKPGEIGELVHSLFNNYNFVTGNIIKLKYRFSLE